MMVREETRDLRSRDGLLKSIEMFSGVIEMIYEIVCTRNVYNEKATFRM